MAPVVEVLPLPKVAMGGSPHWSPKTSSMYLVDVYGCTINRYHPATDSGYSAKIDAKTVGFMTPIASRANEFVVGADRSLLAVKWDGKSEDSLMQRTILKMIDEPEENRINDGKADPRSRLWFGTTEKVLERRNGTLYSYTKGKGLESHVPGLATSNGIAWNEKRNLMYYIDSMNKSIDVWNYSPSGEIGGRRVLFDLQKNNLPFYPMGMTIDVDGNLWVALYEGSMVIKIDPQVASVASVVNIPTRHVTSVAWGSYDLRDLYVTTASSEGGTGLTYRVLGLPTRGISMYEAVL